MAITNIVINGYSSSSLTLANVNGNLLNIGGTNVRLCCPNWGSQEAQFSLACELSILGTLTPGIPQLVAFNYKFPNCSSEGCQIAVRVTGTSMGSILVPGMFESIPTEIVWTIPPKPDDSWIDNTSNKGWTFAGGVLIEYLGAWNFTKVYAYDMCYYKDVYIHTAELSLNNSIYNFYSDS